MKYRHMLLSLSFLLLATSALAVDSDGDGVEDNFDNCIEQDNADQRDTNGDGYGNRCDADFNNDLITNATDLAYFKSMFFTADPDSDLNGDGVVNSTDLGILRTLFFLPPGPAGGDAHSTGVDPVEPPSVELELRVIDGCPFADGTIGHNVTATWSSDDFPGNVSVEVTAMPPSGMPILSIGSTVPGNLDFDVHELYGGPLQVLVFVESANGDTASDTASVNLTPCLDRPVIPPGIGFTAPPVNEPPVIGVPDGTADEIDVVHLGGSPFGPVEPRAVVAVGTGAGFKMFSYRIDFNTDIPSVIDEAGPFAGLDIKLHALEQGNHNLSEIVPFVQGVRREGNLWLRSWQLINDGVFKDFSSVGYGENADVVVEAYAIAHRVLGNGDFQIVTPVRTQRNNLRTITWRVDRNTGQVSGIQDSGDWGNPSPSTELSIAHLDGSLYVINYRTAQGVMASRYWRVSSTGTPTESGGGASGFNLRGTGQVQEGMLATKVMPLGTDEFFTPIVKNDQVGTLEAHVWETRMAPFNDFISFNPYQISDNTRDAAPNDYGISIVPAPSPTNAVDGTGAFLQNVRAILTDGLWEDAGIGDGRLFSAMPFGELTSVHLASVTKVMTLLLAVEAIDNGTIDLNDELVVSAPAAAVGGSQVNLEEGEVQTLRTMLYGMMLRSGNDAAAAIAEHISGNSNAFADLMDWRAQQLGLSNTTYPRTNPAEGAPAGGGLSTPQDQVTLWRFANELPLFRQIAEARQYSDCGEDAQGNEKCYFWDKFADSGYPGLEGWKNGNTGFFVPGYSDQGGPYCVGSGCLLAQTTRLDRTMHVALQQSGNRWGDHDELLDYGYRLQFTPDRRGSEKPGGSVADFGLDDVGDSMAIVARIDTNDDIAVCSWSMFADLGQMSEIGCEDLALRNVAGSPDRAAPTLIDGSRISTFLVEGDYLSGHVLPGGALRFNLWRVGPTEP